MKKLLFAVALVLTAGMASGSAEARQCEAALEDQFGSTLQRFSARGMDRQDACMQARRQCKRELVLRSRGHRRLNCRVIERRLPPRRVTCSASIVTMRGRSIDFFRGMGFDRRSACSQARQMCSQELRRRQRRGQNPRAVCQVDGRGNGGGHGQMVNRTCSVDRIGRGGRLRQSHTAMATGRQGTGVKQRACNKAQRQCEMASNMRQHCVRSRF